MSLKKHLFLILLVVCQIVSPTISAKKKVGIPSEKDMAAYLMVYFKDDTAQPVHGIKPRRVLVYRRKQRRRHCRR